MLLGDPLALVTAHADHVLRAWDLDSQTSTPVITCIAAGPFALSADADSRTWCHIDVERRTIHFFRAGSLPHASLGTDGAAVAVQLLCRDVVVYATTDAIVHVAHREGYRFRVPVPFVPALHCRQHSLTGVDDMPVSAM